DTAAAVDASRPADALAPHPPDRRPDAEQLQLLDDAETVAFVGREVPLVRRLEIGGRAGRVRIAEHGAQHRRTETLALMRRRDTEIAEIPVLRLFRMLRLDEQLAA